jgi:hypothetical protein
MNGPSTASRNQRAAAGVLSVKGPATEVTGRAR